MQNPSCLKDTFNTLAWKTISSLLLGLCLWSSLVIPASAAIDPVNLLGRYEHASPTNDWHKGNLTWHPTESGKMRWTNDAGASWSVTPDFTNGVLITEADFPYALTAPNMPMQFLGAAGASAVDSFQINGETYSRRFTIRNDYTNNTTNSNHLIRGPFVVWWEFGQDQQARATSFLEYAERVRNDQWAFGMLDMTSIRAGHHTNIFLVAGENNPFGWVFNNTISLDSNYSPNIFVVAWEWAGTLVHEAFHAVQYSDNFGHQGSMADTLWFLEASAVWYPGTMGLAGTVMSGTVSTNPHLPLWATYNNDDGSPGSSYRTQRTYGLGQFLAYLTNVKAVPVSLIANFYATDTPITPQEYLYNQIGPANFRQYFTEWTAKDAAYQDYLSRAEWTQATDWVNTYGNPADIHRHIQTYTDSGTNGAWVSPPANLAPRGWSSNVFRVINTAAATYTLQLNGNATGTEGTPSLFTGTAVVMNPAGNQYHPFTMNSNTQGTVTVTVPASATEVFFVIDAVPAHFNGNQTYPYQVKIDRNLGTTQLITAGSTWKYSATGTAAPANWAQPGFADDAWPSGPGMLGKNITGRTPATTINNTTAITTYYRHSFTVEDPSQFQKLNLSLLRDDGAVVWLNGVELHRSNMPAGTITSTTLASTAITGAAEDDIHTSNHNPTAYNLVAGTNVIAVELHQSSTSTGDLGFDLSLDAEFEIPSFYSYGPLSPDPFTITASDRTRVLGGNTTFSDATGSIYWRGTASDATYMHFNLSSLAGGTISGDVYLNQPVSDAYGSQITSGQISAANAAWTGAGAAPGFAAIPGSTAPADGAYPNLTASWTLPSATFQGFVNSPSTFHGLVLTGGAGSTAHFSGPATLTGSVSTGQIVVSNATDWRAASFNAGGTTLTVSGSDNVIGGNVLVRSGATLSVVGAATLDLGSFYGSFANNGTLSFGSSAAQALNGVISGSGALVKDGSGTLTLGAHNTYTGTTTINSGTLEIGGGGSLGGGSYAGAISIASGAILQNNNGSQDLTGNITGDGGITHNGGHLVLTGNNTYSGVTTINSGRLFMGSLSPNTSFVINGAAQLYGGWNIPGATFINNMTLSGMGFVEGGVVTGVIRASSGQTFSGNITLAGDSRIGMIENIDAGATFSGKITGNHALDLQGSIYESYRTITMTLANTGAENDFTGNTSISTSDFAGPRTGIKTVLRLGADNQIPNGPGKGDLVFNGANADHQTIFELNGYNETINGLSNTAADGAIIRNTAFGASTLTIGDADTTSTFSGAITDGGAGSSLALTKTGTGTLVLSGNNGYTGTTTVSLGTLALVGGSQASPITVSSGASLGFTLGSPTTSTRSFNLTAGTVKITGTPTLPSYTLISSSTGVTGTPTLSAPIAGYALMVDGTSLKLVQTGGYASWMAPFITGGLTGDTTPGGDPENDGMTNLLEYALNGNPSISDPSIQPDLVVTATHFEFTYSRLDLSLADTTQSFEYGSDLTGWTPVIIPTGPGTSTVGAATVTIADTGATDSVTIRIPKSVSAGGNLFGRLKVVK